MIDTAKNSKDGPFHVHVFPQLLEVGKRLGLSVSSVYFSVLRMHNYMHVYVCEHVYTIKNTVCMPVKVKDFYQVLFSITLYLFSLGRVSPLSSKLAHSAHPASLLQGPWFLPPKHWAYR